MRAFLLGISGLVLAGALACGGGPAATPAGGDAGVDAGDDPRQMFVGTWKLVRFERYDADGQLLPAPEAGAFGAGAPLGYIMYDGEHMGVVIQQENRKPFAGAQPTGDEAIAAISSYVSYFGPYTVNEAEGYVTHHVLGSNSPAMTGADNQRFYEFSGNELALMPPPGDNGVQARIVWEKMASKANLSAEQRRFLGFWRINYVEQGPPGGDAQPAASQYAAGYIIYMPSGHMAVHLLRTEDRPEYAGGRPTGDEAISAFETYGSYAGPFIPHPTDGYVLHRRTAALSPGSAGVDAQRFYEFRDNELILMPVPREVDGSLVQRYIHWERLSTLDAG